MWGDRPAQCPSCGYEELIHFTAASLARKVLKNKQGEIVVANNSTIIEYEETKIVCNHCDREFSPETLEFFSQE